MRHRGLVRSLFLHGTIETSQAKAKAIRGLADKIINLAKSKTRIHLLQSYLVDKNLQDRLVKEIVPKLGTRTSGYTSLVRLGPRLGDRYMMVRMSLIGAEGLKPIEKSTTSGKSTTGTTGRKETKTRDTSIKRKTTRRVKK